jgi:hypothetical protein
VMQQGLDAVRPESGGFGDEQPAERHISSEMSSRTSM